MSLKSNIDIYGQTDVGSVRDHNEDAIITNPDLGICVLADGMGGHKGGEMASAITIGTVIETLTEDLKNIKPGKTDDETGYSMESKAAHDAVALANSNVFMSSSENEKYRGMGTTVVVLLFYDNRFSVVHVGDSRLYRLRDGILEPITRDHSLMQELIDRGFYTPEQARTSMNKNLVTRAIGIEDVVQIDVTEDIALVDDIYMMCSDGITDMIDDDLIQNTMLNCGTDLKKMAEELIREANAHGGKDNISVILARPIKPFPARNGLFSRLFDIFS